MKNDIEAEDSSGRAELRAVDRLEWVDREETTKQQATQTTRITNSKLNRVVRRKSPALLFLNMLSQFRLLLQDLTETHRHSDSRVNVRCEAGEFRAAIVSLSRLLCSNT